MKALKEYATITSDSFVSVAWLSGQTNWPQPRPGPGRFGPNQLATAPAWPRSFRPKSVGCSLGLAPVVSVQINWPQPRPGPGHFGPNQLAAAPAWPRHSTACVGKWDIVSLVFERREQTLFRLAFEHGGSGQQPTYSLRILAGGLAVCCGFWPAAHPFPCLTGCPYWRG